MYFTFPDKHCDKKYPQKTLRMVLEGIQTKKVDNKLPTFFGE